MRFQLTSLRPLRAFISPLSFANRPRSARAPTGRAFETKSIFEVPARLKAPRGGAEEDEISRGMPKETKGWIMSPSKAVSSELPATERASLSALLSLSDRELWSSAVVANADRPKAIAPREQALGQDGQAASLPRNEAGQARPRSSPSGVRA